MPSRKDSRSGSVSWRREVQTLLPFPRRRWCQHSRRWRTTTERMASPTAFDRRCRSGCVGLFSIGPSSGAPGSAGMPSPERRWWVRFENEASACPACRSSRIRMLDVFSIPRTPERRRLAFISGCRACGLLFVNPLPSANQLQKYYSEQGTWAERKSDRVKEPNSVTGRPRPDRLMSALEPHAPRLTFPGKVLDFGCGDGKFLNRMKARGWQTYGIEPSTDAAFRSHHRLLDVPQDGSFDFVVLNHGLEHLLDPLNTLQRLAGSLRDGGILFVSTPRLDTLPRHRDLK